MLVPSSLLSQHLRYIRCVGFLYLRFCAPPKDLWDWFFDYIDEPTPVRVKQGARAPEVPLGKWLRGLLTVCHTSQSLGLTGCTGAAVFKYAIAPYSCIERQRNP